MKSIIKQTKVSHLYNFENKITLIVGAGGVGKIFAQGFGEQGAKIIILDKSVEICQQTCDFLKQYNVKADYIIGNVAEQESVFRAVDKAFEKYGRIDILLHTAGVTLNKQCTQYSANDVDFIIDVNLKGTIFTNQAVAKVMKKQTSGKIINIGSIGGGFSHMDESMVYEASKAGVHAVVRSFANELASYNINVNSIAPFWINTPLISHQPKSYFEKVQKLTPFERCLEPEELLGAAYYLASDASNFVTGQILYVDGGYSSIHSMSMNN